MKRELKVHVLLIARVISDHRKAHPDEKGTESYGWGGTYRDSILHRKAHPDEKGTESEFLRYLRDLNAQQSQGPSR